MFGIAQTRFARYAPRKVNQVLSLIRNKPVQKAFEILRFTPKSAATIVSKTLKSAVSNAGRLRDFSNIKVKECWVGQGPYLKRMRPGPMGRGMGYKRKMCHLTIVVDEMSINEIEKNKSSNKKHLTKKQDLVAESKI